MGRKKKVVEEPKEIKTEQTNSIGYKGEVTIKVTHGKKVVKTISRPNEGCSPLFDFIRRCLAGSYNYNLLPRYIRIFDSEDNELSIEAILVNDTVQYSETSTTASVTLNFVVPASILKDDASIKKIKLYNTDNRSSSMKDKPSAQITLDEAITVTSSSNIMISWKMTIGNY